MRVAQLKSKPEQGVFYRLRFNELPTINRSTLGHYCLCEYILRVGKFWDYIKPRSFREKGTAPFVVWFRKHNNSGSSRPTPALVGLVA